MTRDQLPTDPRLYDTDHPTITEAVAWLTGTDTVAITRRHAETLLPHWEHYGALTGREREAILAKFPRVIHAFLPRVGDGGTLWSCRCGWNVIALHGEPVTQRLIDHATEV